jgi:hypothetical protein
MRSASILFALLAASAVLGNVVPWALGVPLRITAAFICAVALFVVLAVFLWRLQRWAAVVGLMVALAELLLIGGAAYFLWPSVRASFDEPRVAINTSLTMLLPLVVNACIAVVLGRVLLSNNRWRGP